MWHTNQRKKEKKKKSLSLYSVTEELRYRLNKSPRQRRQKLDRDFMSRIGIQTASAQFYRVVLKDIDPTGTYESIYRYLRLLRKSKVKMFDCLGKGAKS